MRDKVFIWVQDGAVLIARGDNEEEARENLKKICREGTLVEGYKIMTYDGYSSGADIILHDGDLYGDFPSEPLYPKKDATIIDVQMKMTEREKDKV